MNKLERKIVDFVFPCLINFSIYSKKQTFRYYITTKYIIDYI